MPETLPTPAVPEPVRRAGRLLLLEAVLLTAGAVTYGVISVVRHDREVAAGLGAAGLLLLLAGVLALLGVGVLGLRSWARTPALLLQTITAPVAFAVAQVSGLLPALALVVLPALVLALLLGPSARSVFVR